MCIRDSNYNNQNQTYRRQVNYVSTDDRHKGRRSYQGRTNYNGNRERSSRRRITSATGMNIDEVGAATMTGITETQWRSIITVSYTHLDVYKRQMEQEKSFRQYRRRRDEMDRNNGRRDALYENNGHRPNNNYNNNGNHYPVSYTHLDVYKRQMHQHQLLYTRLFKN